METRLKNPLITVLICVGKIDLIVFKRSLDSIFLQSFQDFEIIVVEDASTVDVKKFLKAIKDERLIIINNSINLGLTKSLNIGLLKASGKYIARLDADDFCSLDRLQKQFEFMESHPDYVICGSAYDEVTEAGEKLIVKVPIVMGANEIKKVMTSFNPFAHSTLIIKRSELTEIGNYFEFFRFSQDYFMTARLLQRGLGHNLADVLVTRLRSADQISHTKYKQQLLYSIIIRIYCCLYYPLTRQTLINFSKSIVSLIIPRSLKELISK
jgi:glycosyltransferase involved in cell wall biosynthesis